MPSSLSRNLQAFDGQAAAKKIDYSSPHYGRDHTPGGQWDLLDEQSTQTAGRGGEERVLQGLAAEFTGLWLPTGVAQDGMGHVIICQKTGLVVIFDVAANGYFGAGGRVLIDIQVRLAFPPPLVLRLCFLSLVQNNAKDVQGSAFFPLLSAR